MFALHDSSTNPPHKLWNICKDERQCVDELKCFPFCQNFQFNWLKCKQTVDQNETFQNKWTTLIGYIPLFCLLVSSMHHYVSFLIYQWDCKFGTFWNIIFGTVWNKAFPFDTKSFQNLQPKIWAKRKMPHVSCPTKHNKVQSTQITLNIVNVFFFTENPGLSWQKKQLVTNTFYHDLSMWYKGYSYTGYLTKQTNKIHFRKTIRCQ